ncbi:MAG TPA: serine protease [Caulobacteraceae bacterium]|nr:serine protease [Caulobacteraceae bacterium]
MKLRDMLSAAACVAALALAPAAAQAWPKAKGKPEATKTAAAKPAAKSMDSKPARKEAGRIVNGVLVAPGAAPWTVSLVQKGYAPVDGHFCGGTLIDTRWVLTAAHCMGGGEFQVHAGTQVLNYGGVTFDVMDVIVHPSYDPSNNDNDIALVRLGKPSAVRQVTRVEPLRLARPGEDATRNAGVTKVLGWGAISEGGPLSTDLLEVEVPLVTPEACNAATAYGGVITNNMICAGYMEGQKDSCQGDSGGPLVAGDPNQGWTLIGVVSWGEGCARPNRPGVYAKVANYYDWIFTTMAQHWAEGY